jgi:ABC-type phosphate transport system substrate-binding protein
MTKNTLWKSLGVVCLSLFTCSVLAELVVVVHPSNAASLDAKSVKRIFLGKEKKFSDGSESIPINQVSGAANRTAFDSDILGRSSTQVSAYWSKLVFTGKGIPPKEVADDAAVIAIVAENPSAIGYVESTAVTAAVKAIALN